MGMDSPIRSRLLLAACRLELQGQAGSSSSGPRHLVLGHAGGETERYYAALRAHCARKPGVTERRRWREVLFRVHGRVLAFMNSPARPAVTVKHDRDPTGNVLTRASVTPA